MARRRRSGNLRYGVMAVAISMVLWGIAHGERRAERNVDIPVAFDGLPDDVVITEQSTSEINIRVQGSRAALRNLAGESLEYVVDVSGVRRGSADFDVPQEPIEAPRGAEVVSRSPSRLEVKFERRGTKVMAVRADLAGEPAQGFRVAAVEVEPPRVTVTGARREVLRLNEAVTEAIDITGLSKETEREARLSLGGTHVWVEQPTSVKVRVRIEPVEAAGENGAG